MKNLENFGVVEMNNADLALIDGGNWFGDAWDATVEAVDSAIEAVGDFFEGIGDGISAGIDGIK